MGRQFFGHGPYAGGDNTAVAIVGSALRFVIWVLVILAIIWIVREIIRHLSGTRAAHAPAPSPALAELELRYARGEVNRDDYLVRRADLGGAVAPMPPPVA